MPSSKHWPFSQEPIDFQEPMDLQDAIDLAVEKKTQISFPCSLSNKEIREAEVDWKECHAFKAGPEGNFVCIYLYSFHNEIFG